MSRIISIPDHILFEDDVILIINKPAGLMVEPDRNGHPNLLYQVRSYIKNSQASETDVYAQHLHRLDRPVSGIVLFAKQQAVLRNLSEQFAQRTVKKFYQALTEHAPAELSGTLTHWHRKEKKKAILYNEEVPYSEHASLSYSVTKHSDKTFLWNIELYTGKYHQIRAQLASTGCPIIGDEKYGSATPYQPNAIALHACRLVFAHPVTNEEIIVNDPKF